MKKLVFRSPSVEKTVGIVNGRIAGADFVNLLTGKRLNAETAGFYLRYSFKEKGKKLCFAERGAVLREESENGYTVCDESGKIIVKVAYDARESGELAKTIEISCREDIFIEKRNRRKSESRQ